MQQTMRASAVNEDEGSDGERNGMGVIIVWITVHFIPS
jgi:hypothetical protein